MNIGIFLGNDQLHSVILLSELRFLAIYQLQGAEIEGERGIQGTGIDRRGTGRKRRRCNCGWDLSQLVSMDAIYRAAPPTHGCRLGSG